MQVSVQHCEPENSIPTADVTVVVADAYPNFSICGIPYYVLREATHWRNLAHRYERTDLEEREGTHLRFYIVARRIDASDSQTPRH